MGTRHLIAVVAAAKHCVAQYGQFDGYPECQGVVVADFARKLAEPEALAKFKEQLTKCRFGTKAEFDKIMSEFTKNKEGWMTSDEAKKFEDSQYGYLSRNTSAEILDVVNSWEHSEPLLLSDQWTFAADGLFCEWAYVIDVDKGQLEVYSGFHKGLAPKGERFAKLNKKVEKDSKYGPVRHLATFSFDQLKGMSDDQFIAACVSENDKLRGEQEEVEAEAETTEA